MDGWMDGRFGRTFSSVSTVWPSSMEPNNDRTKLYFPLLHCSSRRIEIFINSRKGTANQTIYNIEIKGFRIITGCLMMMIIMMMMAFSEIIMERTASRNRVS